MSKRVIIGTAGHIDHGKTSLIKALNGFEGDETKQEKQRGITIDLSFSNMQKDDKNIAFIDVPGHEKLVKNMIAGAFGFDIVMLVVAVNEKIMPQTIEHLQILQLLDKKDIVVVFTKKDLVSQDQFKTIEQEVLNYLEQFDLNILFTHFSSIKDEDSISSLKQKLFTLENQNKEDKNFFRYYIDRVFSPKGIGTVVTGTILGGSVKVDDKLFVCELNKEVKVKNIQVHNQDTIEANISNRTALNLSSIDSNKLQRGFLLSKKGYLRGFNNIDISFKSLKNKKLHHNRQYQLYIGSKQINVKALLFNSQDSLENGFATIKSSEEIFSVFNEKLILRDGNETIAGAKVLNPIADPIKKSTKFKLLNHLDKQELEKAYELLIQSHKKGFGLVSSMQRFSLSHDEAIAYSKTLEGVFIDEKELIIYPNDTKEFIKEYILNLYIKNPYALLSINSLNLRLKWASFSFIQEVVSKLCYENFLTKDGNLYKKSDIKEDIKPKLQEFILQRLEKEIFTPTAPYNIYDELDIDRKLGDNILKTLCSKGFVKRLQHNLFIHSDNLIKIIKVMNEIIEKNGYIDIKIFKESIPMSRKYLIAYLEYFDTLGKTKKVENKRVLIN